MTTKQPEALRLAGLLRLESESERGGVKYSTAKQSEKELRRLHAENEALKQQIAATQPAAQGMDEERLRNLLCKMVDQLERRWKHRDGNAPGHGHSLPGVWDGDNGELAGKKCAWCEVWQEALEVHDAAQAKQTQ